MMPILPRLDELDSHSRDDIGGKAANLGRLVGAGFEVPAGFVIPVEVTKQLDGSHPTEWPAEICEAIAAAYRQICPAGETVAVRSSATDEDSDSASFAGQHETVLGVDGDGLLAAITSCLSSLDSDASRAYRAHAGRSGQGAMAVVIQRMIEGDASGVAFSIDPATGDRERIVVEAVPGRGEGLVGGTTEADRMVFARDTLAIVEQHETGASPLTEAAARRIAALALEVEQALGGPQDIEFTVEGASIWLLQARSVTTSAAAGGPGWVSEFDTPTDDSTLWTSANVQEVLPGLITPLAITSFEVTGYLAYTVDYYNLHVLDRGERPEFVGFFYNRAFLNVSAVRLIADRAIFTSGDAIENRYLGGTTQSLAREPFLRRWKYRLKSAPGLLRAWLRVDHDVDHMERQVREAERRLSRVNMQDRSDSELEDLRQRAMGFGARMFRIHLRVTGAAGGIFDQVADSLRPLLGDETEEVLPALFSGMQDVESAQLAIGLWDLSRAAREAGIADAMKSPGFDPRDPSLPEAWREAIAAFLERHGHRGLNEMEASARPWRQDPQAFMGTVASYVDLDESQSPRATLERQAARRVELTEELAARMNPVRRAVFRWQLGQAQKLVSLRERTKSLGVRAARFSDFFMPEYERRLLDAGIIGQPDDLHFLTRQELDDIFYGRAEPDYRERMMRRRREMERNRHVELPERFFGRPVPIEPDIAAHAGDVLTGTPVSSGQVTGRARVILDPARDGGILPGEILVAPVTDAGWTPLFAMAAGLVVDMGSALSHGSTVAREYGLPAVVNVRRATQQIRTGDLIAVNGSKGTVAILEAADAHPAAEAAS